MVRLVFRSNKPMKIGVLMMAVGVVVLVFSVVNDSVELRATGIGVMIAATLVYMTGRMMQIIKQRPR